MGTGGSRWGAGRPGYRGKAEQCLRVDIRWMRRKGFLRGWGGTLTYSIGGQQVASIGYWVTAAELVLDYTLNGDPRQQRVPFLETPCNYGGVRQWFACPYCLRRCEVLYCRRGGFYCRTCARVSYCSQSEDAVDRTWRIQQKAAAKLGENWRRPKGMHRTTYERLFETIIGCEDEREEMLFAYLGKLGTRLGAMGVKAL